MGDLPECVGFCPPSLHVKSCSDTRRLFNSVRGITELMVYMHRLYEFHFGYNGLIELRGL